MDDINQFDTVAFHGVEFNSNGMALFSHQSKVMPVNKKDIRQITLKYGFQSERPIVEIVFGIFVIGLGIYFFANFLLKIMVRGIIYLDELLSLFLLPLSGWFIMNGSRKRYYFEITLHNDKRKFPLDKNPDESELRKFIKMAAQLGYSIDATKLDELI